MTDMANRTLTQIKVLSDFAQETAVQIGHPATGPEERIKLIALLRSDVEALERLTGTL